MRIREKYKFIKEISEELDIPVEKVEKVCMSQWSFIRKTIKDLPLKRNDLTEEEFGKLRVNFNLPKLGKLYTTYRAYKAGVENVLIGKQRRNENSTQEGISQV